MLRTLRERLVPPLNRDGKLVVAASAVRALDYGFLSIFLGVYLSLLEFSALQAGLVFSGIMAGGALSNVVCTWRGDAIGRRRMLVAMAGLMVLGGILLPFASSAVALGLIGLIAMTTSTGGDRTAFLSLDTAILAGASEAPARMAVSSVRNAVRSPPVEVVMAMRPTSPRATALLAKGSRTPPSTIRHAMATSILRRPIASPRHVATTLDIAPPAIMPLNTRPACSAE